MMSRVITITLVAGALAGCLSGPPARPGPSGLTQAERIDLLEERVRRLDNLAESGQMVELMQRVDTLHAEVRELRGEVERLGHDSEALGRRQRELYLDLDRRLQNLEAAGRGAAGGGTASAPPATRPAQTAAADEEAAPARPTLGRSANASVQQREYDVAYRMLLEGRYPIAINAFRQFLEAYPEGPLSDNAQYWLGEAHYVSRDFPAALEEFKKVIERFPQSPKVPDALLKIGYTQYELRQWDEARRVLADVSSRAPDTTVARLAQQRLDRMRQEGR